MVMVCLHRFCGECINKCIRMGMKECPNCRKSIPSRRSLRRDTNFDHIVNTMVGSPSERQLREDQKGKLDAKKIVHLQRAIIKKKHIVEQQKQRTVDPKMPGLALLSRQLPPPGLTNLQQSPLLELELRRHPHEDRVDQLERGFLTIRGDTKVSLLKDFLSQKLEDRTYEISSRMDDDSVVLDDHLALSDAKESLCVDQPLVLKYRISANDPGGREDRAASKVSTTELSARIANEEEEGFAGAQMPYYDHRLHEEGNSSAGDEVPSRSEDDSMPVVLATEDRQGLRNDESKADKEIPQEKEQSMKGRQTGEVNQWPKKDAV
jgi:hypothetical protein